MTPELDALSAAVSALGAVMMEMTRRRLMPQYKPGTVAHNTALAKALTDEQVGTLAAKALDAGAMLLAKRGYPGATYFACTPSEEP